MSCFFVGNGFILFVVIVISDLYWVCNILIKCIYGFQGIGIFEIDFIRMVDGDCVGLVLFCDKFVWIGIVKDGGINKL